ncbi:MAG: TonB-dependent receptor [Betaproteobacteria bacterium]|nr:TonB-dependent receptor [Betaproteobacteria bacterium]
MRYARISRFAGSAETASGGIVDLDREFGGIGVRLTRAARIADRPLVLTVGADSDRQRERRLGFVNRDGAVGDLRRDEDDFVAGSDAYAQLEWSPLDALSLTAGIRYADVRLFRRGPLRDGGQRGRQRPARFQPCQSGAGRGLASGAGRERLRQLRRGVRNADVRGNRVSTERTRAQSRARRGDQPGGRSGTQDHRRARAPDRCRGIRDPHPRRNRHRYRGGRPHDFPQCRRDAAQRIEAAWDGRWPLGFTSRLAWTYIAATFANEFRSGTPAVTVPAGARLPGVPASSAYGELAWAPGGAGGLQAALEVTLVDRIFINDRNSDAAPRYAVVGARVGLEQRFAGLTLREFVRVDNLADRRYAGSVIVGDANGRSFEPAPGRNWSAGVTLISTY